MELLVVGEDRKPIAGFAMELVGSEPFGNQQVLAGEPINFNGDRLQLRSDQEGRVVLSMPKDLLYFAVFIEAPGYAPYRMEWKTQKGHAPPARQTLELEKGWAIGGILVDEKGVPIADAFVQPRIQFERRTPDQSELNIRTTVRSDARGRWKYDSVPPNMQRLTVSIRKNSFRPLELSVDRESYEIKPNSDPSFRSVLTPFAASVQGRVLDANGKPVVGAMIRSRIGGKVLSTVTDEDGSYALEGKYSEWVRVVVSAPGFATDVGLVNFGKEPVVCNFELQPARNLRVRFVDRDGNPVVGVRVQFQSWRERFDHWEFDQVNPFVANPDGIWDWNEAPLDGFRANFFGLEGSVSGVSLIPRDEEYVIVLPTGIAVSGKVRDAATGKPIPAFSVTPGRIDRKESVHWDHRAAKQGRDGQYEIKIPTPDNQGVFVRIEAPGYARVERRIEVEESPLKFNTLLRSARSRDLIILTPEGAKGAGAEVGMGRSGARFRIDEGELQRGGLIELSYADHEGRCYLELPVEPAQVVITHQTGYAIVRGDAEQQVAEVKLKRWGEIIGECSREERGLANTTWCLRYSDAAEKQVATIEILSFTRSDSSGVFRFSRLIEGRMSLTPGMIGENNGQAISKESSQSQYVEVKSDTTTKVLVGNKGR